MAFLYKELVEVISGKKQNYGRMPLVHFFRIMSTRIYDRILWPVWKNQSYKTPKILLEEPCSCKVLFTYLFSLKFVSFQLYLTTQKVEENIPWKIL